MRAVERQAHLHRSSAAWRDARTLAAAHGCRRGGARLQEGRRGARGQVARGQAAWRGSAHPGPRRRSVPARPPATRSWARKRLVSAQPPRRRWARASWTRRRRGRRGGPQPGSTCQCLGPASAGHSRVSGTNAVAVSIPYHFKLMGRACSVIGWPTSKQPLAYCFSRLASRCMIGPR